MAQNPDEAGKVDRWKEKDELKLETVRVALWEGMLGVKPAPDWLDDSDAPPVDEDLLRRLRSNKLATEETANAWRLILHFRTWARAYVTVVESDILNDRTKN